MVTKRTGRPRGRPRKQSKEKPSREPGRPSIHFLDDPDRYLVAWMDAHAHIFHTSERDAAKFVSMMTVADEKELPDEERHSRAGYIKIAWAVRRDAAGLISDTKRVHGMPFTIKGRADTLRKKSRLAFDQRSEAWRMAMAIAFACAIVKVGERSREETKRIARLYANSVGENEYVEARIIPAIDYLFEH